MSELTIGEMIEQVPEGEGRTFERSVLDAGEERFSRVWQNWDYRPGRLEWRNPPSFIEAPSAGNRRTARIPLATLPPLDVRFKGPAKQVVDFYSTGSDAFFVSDKLFSLIERMDPGSLENIGFELHAKDGLLPFHAVMPNRILEAVDTGRTTVRIEDEDLASWYLRHVRFPEGIIFDNELLVGAASFSDLDAHGWYWSRELLVEAKSLGILGLYAVSAATVDYVEVERF
jgi:hypothetical protein